MNFGDNDDTIDEFDAQSNIPVPQIRQTDPRGGFTDVPDCAYGGVGTGAETLHPDGSVTTRYKGSHQTSGGSGVIDGGTP